MSVILKRYRRVLNAHVLTPILFAAISIQHLSSFTTGVIGVDARIYYRASAAWVAGGNPWDAFATHFDGGITYHFAALPPTVVALAPFTFLPEEFFVWSWLVASGLIAVWTTRRLNLRWWWVMFPPTVLGVVSGNPQIHLLGLVLSGRPALEALAPILKVYAVIPLIGERRNAGLAISSAIVIATSIVAAPLWGTYLSDGAEIAARLGMESGGGYSGWVRPLPLLPIAAFGLVLLAFIDFRAASWLAAVALFPSTQFHIATLALPVLARSASPWTAAGLALPFQGLPALVVGAYGMSRFRSAWRKRMLGVSMAHRHKNADEHRPRTMDDESEITHGPRIRCD